MMVMIVIMMTVLTNTKPIYIEMEGKKESINKINANKIYQKIVKVKFKKPIAQKNISNKLNDCMVSSIS